MSYIISRPWGGSCGIGHQFQNWLVGYLLAKRYGLTFVHSPFCGDITEQQIDIPVKHWEQFLGIGRGFQIEQHLPQNIKRISLPFVKWDESSWYNVTCDRTEWRDIITQYQKEDVLFECAKNQFIGIDWPNMDSTQLRNNYWHTRSSAPIVFDLDRTKTNVAIHIRRGDVSEKGRYSIRWVPDSIYHNVIGQIRSVMQNVVFHIYSDGTPLEMSGFEGDDIVLHLRENVFNTFHHMVCADIFMPGQSAFSVLAGHLCSGIVLARPWSPIWDKFPQNGRFVVVDKEGNLCNDLV
jgi:hypothetical protein